MWSSIEQLISEITEQVRQLQEAIQLDEFNMEQLKKAGISYAGVWWKAGKYLYLVHPSDGYGYRQREYIGADPEKVQMAMDSLKRGQMFLEAKQRRDRNVATLSSLQRYLASTHGIGRQLVTASVLQDVPGCTNLDDQLQLTLN